MGPLFCVCDFFCNRASYAWLGGAPPPSSALGAALLIQTRYSERLRPTAHRPALTEPPMLKLATWNVNSLAVRLPQLLDWLAANPVDALVLQETKLTDDKFPH